MRDFSFLGLSFPGSLVFQGLSFQESLFSGSKFSGT